MLHQNLSYYLGPLFFKVGPHAEELSDICHEKGYQYRIGVLKYYFVKFQIALSRCQVYIPEARGVNQSHRSEHPFERNGRCANQADKSDKLECVLVSKGGHARLVCQGFVSQQQLPLLDYIYEISHGWYHATFFQMFHHYD